MIHIKIQKKEDYLSEIKLKGHALYDDYGKDIVCAGVSAILTTSVNGVLKVNKNACHYKQEKDIFTIYDIQNDSLTQILMQNMIDLLKELANNYPKNIKVESEE